MRETLNNARELRAFLLGQIAGAENHQLAVQAGHFMLGYERKLGKCVPLIEGCYNAADLQLDDEQKVKIARIGQFPTFTFRMGAEAVAEAKKAGIDAKLLLILDNIGFMHTIKDNGTARNEFLKSFATLPEQYLQILAEMSLSLGDLERSRRHRLCFPETWMRERFMKRARKGMIGVERSGEHLVFENIELGHCELGGNCASEYSMFLNEIKAAGYEKLISFIPFSCRVPVTSATEIAGNMFGWDKPMEATNIFIEGSEISAGVDAENANFTILVSTH